MGAKLPPTKTQIGVICQTSFNDVSELKYQKFQNHIPTYLTSCKYAYAQVLNKSISI